MWTLERLKEQVFSDEVQVYKGAFTQSFVTVLIDGNKEDINRDCYTLGCVQHKYFKPPAWMFHNIIYNRKKGPAVFQENEQGLMDSKKYNNVILARI